jgi:XRE family transcriptional regulator, master regulator for biofilm formation
MLGAKIYEIRKQRGYTLSNLAKKAGISKSYLSNIERNLNKNPSIQVIKNISYVLDVDLVTLLQNETNVEDPISNKELIELANELKESGIEFQDYKTLIEFIKWQNKQGNNKDN